MKRYKHKNHSLQDTGYRWSCQCCHKTWLNRPSSGCSASDTGEHAILEAHERFFCEKCECRWLSKPNAICPGIPYRENAFPSALCYGEKVYPQTALAEVYLQLKAHAQASAITDRHVKLYAKDMLVLQKPCPEAYVQTDIDFRLQLLEHVHLALQTGKSPKERYAVEANLLVVWAIESTVLALLVSGRIFPVGTGMYAIQYQDSNRLARDLVTYRVARQLIA